MDPQQRADRLVFDPSTRSQDVIHVHWQLYLYPGALQARRRPIHRYVPAKGFLALVYWGGHGRDGVHGSGEQHERLGLGVSAIPRRLGLRGRGRLVSFKAVYECEDC